MLRLLAVLFVFVCMGLCAYESPAAIIVTGDGSGNTSAPTFGADGFDLPEFNNVGDRGGASAVYLGNRWLITAGHVGAGNVTLGPTTYTYEAMTATQLNTGGAPADLVMFRITDDPGLPMLTLANMSPAVGQVVVMIGNGSSRGALTDYDSSFQPVPPSINPVMYKGYPTASPHVIRWGQNEVEDVGGGATVYEESYLGYTVDIFLTEFNDPTGGSAIAHEAQLIGGDSGGAVFTQDGELVGINLVVGPYPGQPLNLALFGTVSGMADIASYRDQINAIMNPVPEPATILLVLGSGLVAVGLARRRRNRSSVARAAICPYKINGLGD